MFKHKHTMSTKTITITEEAYRDIKSLKHGDESFSELFKRLKKKTKGNSIDRFFGILGPLPDKDVEKRRELYRAIRKETSASFERRQKRLDAQRGC